MTRLPLAVVGVGHLGKEHARILASLPDVELVAVVDPHEPQARAVAERCGTRAVTDHRAILGCVKAAVVAAPTTYHHAVAADFLRHSISVLVEKPITSTITQARELVELAGKQEAVLQVGHIERFNPAFEELQSRPLRPCYLRAERCGGFTGRSTDVGVVLDLMIHDLDLVLALVGAPVRHVDAFGIGVLSAHEDVAQARITFANGCIADLTASRVHPEPVRRMQVWGPEGHAGVDFAKRQLRLMQPSAGLRRGWPSAQPLDPGLVASLKTELFGRHVEMMDVDCSQKHSRDQLTRELEEFVHCVRTRTRPRVDGQAGASALEIATRIVERIRTHAWEGRADGPTGPHELPAPQGLLFAPPVAEGLPRAA